MSIRASVWAWEQELPPRDKLVLVALADHYNDDEDAAWMKQETLAKRTGYTRATVNAALKALEHEHGLISSRGRVYPDGRRASNRYRINWHAGTARPPAAHVKSVDTAPPHVNAVDTDHVNAVDTDHVKSVDNKNLEHRTKNIDPIKTRARESSAEEQLELPAGVPPEVWADFEGHRKDLKKPLTPRAARLIVTTLERAPVEERRAMLENSIARGWTGVFPLDRRAGGDRRASPEERAVDDATKLLEHIQRRRGAGVDHGD